MQIDLKLPGVITPRVKREFTKFLLTHDAYIAWNVIYLSPKYMDSSYIDHPTNLIGNMVSCSDLPMGSDFWQEQYYTWKRLNNGIIGS